MFRFGLLSVGVSGCITCLFVDCCSRAYTDAGLKLCAKVPKGGSMPDHFCADEGDKNQRGLNSLF